MGKDGEWSGLLKLPVEVIISQLRIELGQQASYISELEDKLKEQEGKNIKQSKLEHLEKENLRISKLLSDALNRLGDLGVRNKSLESELFKLLKEKNEKTITGS